jgi:amino acid adenylation domain-containing protein
MTAELPVWPLSYGQQRMWLLSQLADSDAALNLVMAVRLSGALNLPALLQAFNDVIRRHDVLRCVIVVRAGEPWQRPLPYRPVALRLVDLRPLASGPAQVEQDRLLDAEARRPFDLGSGPLVRITVIARGEHVHVVAVAMHHIVTDGWSVARLASEISALYPALRSGDPGPLAGLPTVQYQQFATWQRAQSRQPDGELAGWLDRLAGLTGQTLPLDRPGSARRHTAAVWTSALPPSLTRRLHELSTDAGGSLFILVLATLTTVLHRLSGHQQVAVGTLAAARHRLEDETVLGYFSNVLVIQGDFTPPVPGPLTFRELWRRVRDDCLTAYEHQDFPYEKVLEYLQPRRDARSAPLVSMLCVAQQGAPTLTLPDLSAEPVDIAHPNAHFDLTIELTERHGVLHLAFQYDTGVLTEPTVALLGGYLRAALTGVAADVDVPCDELLIEPPATRSPAPDDLPRPVADPHGADTLHALFETQAALTPDAVALVHNGSALTFGMLNTAANQLARRLRARGVQPEDRIALFMARSLDSMVALLAVLKAGAAYMPLDPSYPEARRAFMLADSGARGVLTTATMAGRLDASVPVVLVDELGDACALRGAGSNLRQGIAADQIAYLIYTSGTTGRPKGVLGTHRGMVNRLRWMWRTEPYSANERACHRTPLSFVDSVAEVFGPLLRGVTADIVDPDVVRDPQCLVDTLAGAATTRLVMVPSLLRLLVETVPDLDRRLPALRTWVCSGERLPLGLATRFHQALPGRRLLNLYGSTEVSADATAIVVEPEPDRITIGYAIDGVRTAVVDTAGKQVPRLVRGELTVGGVALTRGYHGLPGDTAARFTPDPSAGAVGARVFRTRDMVILLAGGELGFLGRADDQVQVRGMRVEPAEVEEALLRHPAVAQAAAIAYPDATGSAALAGYVVLTQPCPSYQLRSFVRMLLPPHLVPSMIIDVDALPMTPSGKIDRRALPGPSRTEQYDGDPARSVTWPSTGAQHAVGEVFAELLPVRWRRVDDDFFQLGGHSILAAALVHRLRERCGVLISLSDLFAAPTIAELAALVQRARPADQTDHRVVARPQEQYESFPLTDVQQAYWIGRDPGFELGNIATHAYFEIDVDRLDLARLTHAVRQLIDRHPALRTIVNDVGTQRVLRAVPQYLPAVIDLRQADGSAVARRLGELREAMSHQVLPADRWPLFDIRISLLPGSGATSDPGRLHVSIDALIADAYSVRLLMAELGELYHRPETALPPIDVTFRDCVVARLAQHATPARDKALAYWRDRMPVLPSGPALPLTMAPSAVHNPRFERLTSRLSPERWHRLRAHAARLGVTPPAVVLAAFTEILTAWSRAPHYTLVLTLFDRDFTHPHVARVVGDFTSLTLLEVDHRVPGDFAARVRRLQAQIWTDLDHRLVSGVEVLREMARSRAGPPGLIAPVVFTSNLGVGDSAAGYHVLGSAGFAVTQTPQLYLDHQVAEGPDGLVLNWDAVTELFPDGLLDDAFGAYAGLLTRLADDEGSWLAPVRGLLPGAMLKRRAEVNAGATARSDATLPVLVARSAATAPDQLAVIGARPMSYRELADRAGRVAAGLRQADVGRGDLVGVVMEKGWEQVVAALGITAAGAAYLPLEPDLPAERLRLLCGRTRPRLLLTQSWLMPRLATPPGLRVLTVDADATWAIAAGGLAAAICADPGDLAYVIYTSGSTGSPKGVMIDHGGAVNTIVDINRRFGVRQGDRMLGVSSLSFDLSVYDIFGLLAAGGTLVLPDADRTRDPGHWLELVAGAGVTVWNSVPTLLGLAADRAELDVESTALRGLRLVLLSGDWIPLALPARVRRLAPDAQLVSLGGATEASIWSVYHRIGSIELHTPPEWTSIPYGRPLANQSVHVFDGDLEPRPDWVPGDLYIGGAGLALGYWDDQEGTAASFVRHPRTGERLYRTGDLARYRPGAELEFLGREDDQVKINGYRVELGEVQTALGGQPGVAAAAVLAIGPREQRRLAAYYVPAAGTRPDPTRLRDGLRAILPEYLVPTTFTAVSSFPLTDNGKLDRAALAATAPSADPTIAPPPPLGASPGAQPVAVPAGLLTSLTHIWQVVLGVDRVAHDESFFALGGTSLVALRLLNHLESRFGVKIPLLRVYESPTVTQLARAIMDAGARTEPADRPSPSQPRLVPDPAGRFEPFPLTPVQEAYWLGSRESQRLGGVTTHTYVELDVVDLDVDRLDKALRRLIIRHDALRIVVLPDGRQRVLPEVPEYRMARTDLTGLDGPSERARLDAIRARISHHSFDPQRWPLFDIRATTRINGQTRLHVSVDLLIADALSFRILQQELLALYADPHGDGSLPTIGCTFRDYLLTVDRLRDGAGYQRAHAYWQDRVATLPPPPVLPLLRDPSEVVRPRFTRLEARLEPADWRRLRDTASARNLTPSSLLCAAFADVLALWTQSARFTINVTTLNRLPVHPDIDYVVGDFTTTTLLAVDASAPTFEQRAGRLQTQLFTDLDYRAVSGIEVLRLLRINPAYRGRAWAPVVFTSMLQPDSAATANSTAAVSWTATVVYGISQTSQVLIDHQVYEHAGALIYNWDHVTDAFPAGLVDAMFGGYGHLLRSLVTDGAYFAATPSWIQ